MLKVGIPQTNQQPLGGAGSLGTDELEYCHGDEQGGETIEELGDVEPQVGVVDMVIIKYTAIMVCSPDITCSNYNTSSWIWG